jgi:RNase P subunit RPR2
MEAIVTIVIIICFYIFLFGGYALKYYLRDRREYNNGFCAECGSRLIFVKKYRNHVANILDLRDGDDIYMFRCDKCNEYHHAKLSESQKELYD